ncbi:hypothetical protein AGLY_006122 [Aphis glycines]|uniref:Pre-C2HC domain-containing protein n=1 Tax=Aphis glycines TaxID=307491 RepID=A0A6G0TTS1_APHGL|nr:hypothetical protein AGLY_006122 [Aphis glycines]
MPQLPNAKTKTNIKNKNINNNNTNNKTIIQDARLNISTNNPNVSHSPTQNNLNSPNNDGWTHQAEKRNRSSSSEPSSPTQNTNRHKKLFISRNRFDVLSQTDTIEVDTITPNPDPDVSNPEAHTSPVKSTNLPPPIIVKGIKDFVSLRSELIDLVGPENFTFKSSINNLKILTKNPETYRAIIHFLQGAEAEFHTYQMQEDKAYRIVIRNLHPTTNTAEIRTALEEIGFQVRQITNVLHKTTKLNLPIFFVDLEPSELNKDIFHINHILHTKVKIEEPYKKRDLVQCQNCQEYGHTKTYCAHTPRCVRCAEHHITSECLKPRNLPAKCALCQGEHPANYKGCQIHKELQRRRNPNSRTIQSTSINNQSNPKTTVKTSSTESNPSPSQKRTYANVTSNQEPPKSNNSNQLDTAELSLVLHEKRIDIALLSETHLTNRTKIHIPDYTILRSNHPDGTAHGGAAIIIRSTILFHNVSQISEPHIQSFTIQITLDHSPISISAAYCPPNQIISTLLFEQFFNSLGNYFIVGGDLNAKHTQWGCHSNSPRGNSLRQVITTKNYLIISPQDPTYWPTSPRKRPDILDIFVSKIPNRFNTIIDNLTNPHSDHSPVLLTLDTSPQKRSMNPTLINGIINWEKFQSILTNDINLNVSLKSPNQLEESVQCLTSTIQNAAWSSCKPKIIDNYNQSNLSLPTYLRSLIVQKRRARATWQRTKYPTDKTNYNHLCTLLKRQMAKQRSEDFAKQTSLLTEKDGSLWKTTRKILKIKTMSFPIKKIDGSLAINDKEKAEVHRHHLSQVFNPNDSTIPSIENKNHLMTRFKTAIEIQKPSQDSESDDQIVRLQDASERFWSRGPSETVK